MKINIYYGGRGNLDDPTLYVIKKMEKILIDDFKVEVHRYNIYEQKNQIPTLPQTLKDVDGIILATTVEWLGIGGYMTQFLDACWLYGDKEKFESIYMQPVVMSTTYGEREGVLELKKAWEILGGIPCDGLSGYVEDMVSFEVNNGYSHIIEKKTENLFRTISHKMKDLPSSNQAVSRTVARPQQLDLTPEEGEQLSEYVSDDIFVKKQREDVKELSSLYASLLGEEIDEDESKEFIMEFTSAFKPKEGYKLNCSFIVDDNTKPLFVGINGTELDCHYGNEENIDLITKVPSSIFYQILSGRRTFQGSFLQGDMKCKGNLSDIKMLDEIFAFGE